MRGTLDVEGAAGADPLDDRWSGPVLKMPGTRVLAPRECAAVLRALDSDPVATCMVAARVQQYGVGRSALGGDLWTRGGPGRALCFSGGNLIPLSGDCRDAAAFAQRALRGPRVCSSLVGRRELALPMWAELEPHWGPAREVRHDQPLLVLGSQSHVAPDTGVRQVGMVDLDVYFAAAVAMFTEEVGLDPRGADGGRRYRERVAATVRGGKAWARFEEGRVVFKAEVGSASDRVAQIQGVWVRPEDRGRGIGTRGTAAVCETIRARGLLPSLYVNAYNDVARASYRKIGFEQVATFATVLID